MTATEFWKKKFGEEPQTDADRLATVMMQEYANEIWGHVKKREEALHLANVVGSCSWAIVQDYDDEFYETECGQTYCIQDGTLEENSHKYCQACGREIKLAETESV